MSGLPSTCFGVYCFMGRPIKISLEEIAQKRGYKIIGEYVNTKTPIEVECPLGHRYLVAPSHFKSGRKCIICGHCGKMTNSIFSQKMQKINNQINALEEIKNSFDKYKFICQNGHIFETRPNILLLGYGCSICSGKKLDENVIKNRLEGRGIKMIGEFLGVAKKAEFECICGNKWFAKVDSVARGGKGCLRCAKTGFKPHLPAFFYLFLLEKENNLALGFGITNNFKQRIISHNVVFKKTKTKATLIKKAFFENGSAAVSLEKLLKQHPSIKDFGIEGFKRECLPINFKDYIFSKIEEYSSSSAVALISGIGT